MSLNSFWDKIRCNTLQSSSKIVLGGLCLKRGFCQGCVLNFSFLVVKHLEWHRASSSAVLGLQNSIAGFKAIGFVVHFCAYICVAFRGFETGGHAASQGWTVFLFRGGGHRKVSSSPKLLFSWHLSPTLKL